jgi:hypothetical protein
VPITTRNPPSSVPYWALVVCLIGFGCLGIFSIGAPLLLLGITLAILRPWRHRVGVIAAGVAAIFGFTLGYLLVVPIRCTTSQSSSQPVGHTICSYIFGVDVPRANINYDPGLLPAVLAGIVVAAGCALGARWMARRIAARRASSGATVA